MAQLNFNAAQVPQLEAQDPLPSGWYNAKIVESEMKQTADHAGAYLALTFEVLDGTFARRKLFTNVNLQNSNPVAAEIGAKTLSAICHSTGVIQVQDSQQLHGIPLQIKVALKPAGAGKDGKYYEASNDVKGYKAIDHSQQPAMGAPTAAPQWAQPAPAQPPQWAQPVSVAPQQQQPFQPPQQQQPLPWQQAAPQQPAAAPQQWQQPAPAPQPAPQQWAQPAPHQASHAGFVGQPAPAQQQPTPAASAPTPPWMQQ